MSRNIDDIFDILLYVFELVMVFFIIINGINVLANKPDDLDGKYDQIYVNVESQDGAYVVMYADVSISIEEDIPSISMTNPTVLSYDIPVRYSGGVCIISKANIDSYIYHLQESDIQYVVDKLTELPVYDGAST